MDRLLSFKFAPRHVDRFQVDYVVTEPELSQEVNLVKDEPLDPWMCLRTQYIALDRILLALVTLSLCDRVNFSGLEKIHSGLRALAQLPNILIGLVQEWVGNQA